MVPSGWDGSGNVRNYDGVTTGDDVCSKQTKADKTPFDTMFTTICDAIENCIARDGQNSPSAAIDFDSHKITGLASATALTDAVAATQVVNSTLIYGGVSTGSANVHAISLSIAPAAYAAGQVFGFIAGYTNTATATLNVNSLGAKTLKNKGQALMGGEVTSARPYLVAYDGTDFQMVNPTESTTYATPAAAGNSQGTATAITVPFNSVSGADDTTGVALPSIAAWTCGQDVVVYNSTAAKHLHVYPYSGDTIWPGAADAAISLAAQNSAIFRIADNSGLIWAYVYT